MQEKLPHVTNQAVNVWTIWEQDGNCKTKKSMYENLSQKKLWYQFVKMIEKIDAFSFQCQFQFQLLTFNFLNKKKMLYQCHQIQLKLFNKFEPTLNKWKFVSFNDRLNHWTSVRKCLKIKTKIRNHKHVPTFVWISAGPPLITYMCNWQIFHC